MERSLVSPAVTYKAGMEQHVVEGSEIAAFRVAYDYFLLLLKRLAVCENTILRFDLFEWTVRCLFRKALQAGSVHVQVLFLLVLDAPWCG